MKVEILFPEVGNLCGDLMNIRYLRQCCPELEVVETDLKSRPAFLEGGVDLVYMGSATEKGLELMVKALTPYREELAAYVDGGQRMLGTGHALGALGEYVQSDQGLRFDGLGLLPTHAEYQMMNRHNSFFLGTYGTGMEIVGFKSLFGHTYGTDDPGTGLFKVVRGGGRRPGSLVEGFRRGGLMATYLTGPLLVLNPPFTKQLLQDLGAEGTLAFEEAAMEAYEARLAEFRDVAVCYNGRRVCREITFEVLAGERIALQGANGCGKSSLLKLLLGEEIPHSGTVETMSGLVVSYVSQNTDHLRGSLTEFVRTQGLDGSRFRTILRKLDVPREQFEKDLADYSSGQKKKVLLAASLCTQAHLYVWDEPLNFIDVISRMQVEDLLLACRPTLLFVEHDARFCDEIATRRIRIQRE